jgi:ATP-binding cassette, subfamily B, bacterial PglK
MTEYIKKLRSLLTRRNKQFLLVLLALTVLLSIIETVGISAIMPFISVASNPELINGGYYKQVFDAFGFGSKSSFVIVCGFVLIGFYIFRGVYNLFYSYLINRFAFGSHHQFAYRLFQGYVGLPYKEFVKRNSATLTKTIVSEASNLAALVQSTLLLLSEVFTVLLLYALLLVVNWKMTLALSVILGFKVLLLTKTLSKIVRRQGVIRNDLQERFYRIIGETLGNFKIVKLIGNEKAIFDSFAQASSGYAKANIINNTISAAPRNILETIGFSALIATVIYILFRYENAAFVIPIISMYALALYRILPAINRMLNAYNSILFLSKSLDIVHADLSYDLEEEGDESLEFGKNIKLEGVSFSYDGKTDALRDVTISIAKGEKVAFVGESGSGKSTLVDLIIGIYKPSSGRLSVDGVELDNANVKSWRAKVGYIPQSIYLFDGTVAENVAFGYEFDEAKIAEALRKANIFDFLTSKDGIHTRVGEGGIQLSGGQKQRIGIARALYSDPQILVLDEATSALDDETEARIMDEIYEASSGKTLLVIAHRLSTVDRCTRVVRLSDGAIL